MAKSGSGKIGPSVHGDDVAILEKELRDELGDKRVNELKASMRGDERFLVVEGYETDYEVEDRLWRMWVERLEEEIRAEREKASKRKSQLRSRSRKGVSARQSKAEEQRQVCRDLVAQLNLGNRSIRDAASRIRRYVEDNKLLKKPPSLGSVMSYIRDLFPSSKK